jgi:hypothetical protein
LNNQIGDSILARLELALSGHSRHLPAPHRVLCLCSSSSRSPSWVTNHRRNGTQLFIPWRIKTVVTPAPASGGHDGSSPHAFPPCIRPRRRPPPPSSAVSVSVLGGRPNSLNRLRIYIVGFRSLLFSTSFWSCYLYMTSGRKYAN